MSKNALKVYQQDGEITLNSTGLSQNKIQNTEARINIPVPFKRLLSLVRQMAEWHLDEGAGITPHQLA